MKRYDERDETSGPGDGPIHVDDLPSLSIRRPVLVLVLNLLIVIAGIAAIMAVETRELPDVDRPVVGVRAEYPGASPETMDSEVISLLEGAVARVSGIENIYSASEENNGRMRIEFRPGVDLDSAASDVREAISRVSRRLPDRVEQINVTKADNDAEAIVNIAVSSDVLLEEQLTRVVEQDIIPELVSIAGVADVQISGDRQRMLRVVVDPLRLASFGLSVTDIAAVLRLAPFDVPAGSFRSEDQQLIVRANASVVSADQVADIIIRDSIRIGDVARVFFGPEDARNYTRLNGQPVIALGVVRQARSNTIRISDGVRRTVEQLNDRFDNLELVVTDDQAVFIKSSVSQVLITLLLAISIVVLTIWVFMGSINATLVPSVAIPVALTGTVAAIWLLGFSINILTLLALVLATGLVVDDAIVVIENVQRRRAQGLGARAAAVLGTRQVFFAVVTTTAVLISVFVPIAFLPSTAGRLFREFGLVLACAVTISSFVSLSLVPAAASRLAAAGSGGSFADFVGGIGNRLRSGYERSLAFTLDRPWLPIVTALAFGALAVGALGKIDRELLPDEDRGMIYLFLSGPDGVGIGYMDRQTQIVEERLQALVDSGEATSVFTVVGSWDPNRSRINVPLAPWSERERSAEDIIAELRRDLGDLPGAYVGIGGGNSLSLWRTGSGIRFALIGNDYDRIFAAAKDFVRAVEDRLDSVSQPTLSYDPTQPQLSVDIDRRRASDLGIDLQSLAATLRAMIDGDELIDLNVDDEAVPILLESSSGDINDPSDLVNLFVTAADGALVPLSSVVTLREEGVASQLDRQAQRRAIQVDAELEPGVKMQSAVDDLQALADEVLPSGISMILLGDAATLEQSSREVTMTYAIAIVVIFLVLAAQFEGFTSATVVLLTVPFGVAAAIFALLLSGVSINIYSQIGLILLIGLMAKNGVLLVEFADQLRDRGESIRDAIEQGALIRLRPVTMTMVSTVLGGLPLILASGAGAEARTSIGWVVFGGLGIAAVFTLFLTPALYLLISRFSTARAAESDRLRSELAAARTIADDAA